jgi:phage terminase large subunit-like protein
MVSALGDILAGLDFNDPAIRARVAQVINDDPKLSSWARSRQSFYYTFQPRPNRPELFDEQQAFMECMSPGVIFLIGGTAAGTTTCGLMKAIYFMLQQQPPPRKDTPFWIISNSLESTITNAWKDKVIAKDMVPDCEIDWDRITWYRTNEGLPLSVPLKPWPVDRGGDTEKNWRIEFKSYEQGREALQARSIGGFLFMEQFPYEMLIEVLGRCRDYSFPGSKLCEFTPIDPVLSAEIEDFDTNGTLPKDWHIFRCNTEMNTQLGAGWIDQFKDSHVSEEMKETRLTGAWGSYEGVIFKSFNQATHVKDFPRNIYGGIEFPPNVVHLRGVDWGASTDHPFAMVWAYRDGMGAYWVYDEYLNGDPVTVWDHAEEIKDRWPWRDTPQYGPTYGDPSRPDMFNNFAQLGIPVNPARNSWFEGIEAVRVMLRRQDHTGEPRLFIDRQNCPRLISELRRYRYLKSATTGRNPNVARPGPLKRADDLCDALRYLIFTDMTSGSGGMVGMHIPVDPARHGIHLAGRNGNRDRRERELDEGPEGGGNVNGTISHRIRPRK